MDLETLNEEVDSYYEKCGEVFLTLKGNIIFHCAICEQKYDSFLEYNDHVLEVHYAPFFRVELTVPLIEEVDSNDQPNNEPNYLADPAEIMVFEEESIEVCSTEEGPYAHTNEIEVLRYESEIEDQIVEEDPCEVQTTEDLSQSESVETSNDNDTKNTICNQENTTNALRTNIKRINIKPTITDRKYECPHCGFSGADKANMKSHIKRHSTIKPHKCSECPKAFHTRTELNTHLRTHTGERPYLCTLCGMSFITSSQLCSHKRRHSDVRNKECPECKMRFHDLRSLRAHMVIHSDKRNYKCKHCDASFKLSTGLRTHMKLHENKREYQCKLCDSRFNQRAGLYCHMKSCHTIVFNSSKAKNEIDE